MKRRSTAGSTRRNSAIPKRRNAPKAKRNRGVSIAGQETVVARLTRERDEALLRETANSEVLRLISKSPGDLELVFRTILEHATSICNANFGTLFRFDGKMYQLAAHVGAPPGMLEFQRRRGAFQPVPGSRLDEITRTKQLSHTADAADDAVPGTAARLGGGRSFLGVPMVKDDELIGVIAIYRQ